MSVKKAAIGPAIAVPTIVAILIAIADIGCRLRTQRMNMEFTGMVPALSYVISIYKDHYHEHATWPAYPVQIDDSMMPYKSSRTEGDLRIETYGTLMLDRRIEIELHPDGRVVAFGTVINDESR